MREAIVLSLLRGGKVCRESIPARTVPTEPRVGGFALVVVAFIVDLTGALPRVRAGAVRLSVVFSVID